MTTQTYATQVTQYFLDAIAAAEAGGAMVNIAGGTLVAGDGNGVVPALSALIAANGVTHEVWRGTTIEGVAVDANNAAQLDILCVIPASIGGVEIGPFAVTEFAILDTLGNCCVVGTTNLQKTTSAQGQVSDLAWIAAIVNGVGQVTVTPPSAGFATMTQVIAAYDLYLPYAIAPVTQTDSTNSAGWKVRGFGARLAAKPADPVSVGAGSGDANAIGVGRAASDAEFAAGAPTGGGFPFPWPTLQQVAGLEFGRLLAVQKITASGTYTPTAGTKAIAAAAQGGGGGGALAGTPPGGSGYNDIGGSGSAGSFALAYFTTGFAGGLSVTIGAGGAGGTTSGWNGAQGGATSFGSLITAPGGPGGVANSQIATSADVVYGETVQSDQPTVAGGVTIVKTYGERGNASFTFGGAVAAGDGGASHFGHGGNGSGQNENGVDAPPTSYGAGGSGGCAYAGGGGLSPFTGGAGAPGVVYVFEFG